MKLDFVNKLASGSPTPGGGGASAYTGMIACSLALMYLNISTNRKIPLISHHELMESKKKIEKLQSKFYKQIKLDADGFKTLQRAMKEKRSEKTISRCSLLATQAPIAMMKTCFSLLDECDKICTLGSRYVVSDVVCAAILGSAAAHSAYVNVIVNLENVSDKESSDSLYSLCSELLEIISNLHDSIIQKCEQIIESK